MDVWLKGNRILEWIAAKKDEEMTAENSVSLSPHRAAPTLTFKPQQLEAFRGTDYEFIRLHSPKALDAAGKSIGKTPYTGWRTAEALDVDAAVQVMNEGHNVGVRLRPQDLVIDVDPRNGGDASFKKLQEYLGVKFSDYPTVVTGSGGLHVYMLLKPEGLKVVGELPKVYPGVEFKTFGRQLVSPGSIHPDTGQAYVWDDFSPALADGLREAPQVLIDLIQKAENTSVVEAGEIDAEQLEEMLKGLNPENFRNHEAWLELMMACHQGTNGAGLEEFVTWSTSDPTYSNADEQIRTRWNSLQADGAGKVTVKTLYKALHDVGKGDLIPQPTAQDDFGEDSEHLQELIAHYEALNAQVEDKTKSLIDRVNADRFTVLTGGKYLVGRESFDHRTGMFSLEWFSHSAIEQHMNKHSIQMPDGKKKPLGTWWVNSSQRRQYDRVVFDPRPCVSPRPELYNLWRGWAVEPVKGDWSKMQKLILEVLCRGDQASYDYVVRWMAHMVQVPDRPAEVALVFKGKKGTGKGTLCNALVDLAGQHGRPVTNPAHFTGKFNEHLADTILLFVDEGFWTGDKSAEGQLKGYITEKTMTIEGKGRPIVQGPNQLHIVMASNENWVVPATLDERRFAVFEADEKAAKAFPHFGALIEPGPVREKILSAMLYDLLNFELGEFHPRNSIPQTAALTGQKLEGLKIEDPLAFWWKECLEDGQIFGDRIMSYCGWPDAWQADPEVKEHILSSLNRHQGRNSFTKTKLAKFLAQVGVDIKSKDKLSTRVWSFPDIEDARAALESYLGVTLEWTD